MLNQSIGYINSQLLTFLFYIGLPLALCFKVRHLIVGSLLAVALTILLGNLVRVLIVLTYPMSELTIAIL